MTCKLLVCICLRTRVCIFISAYKRVGVHTHVYSKTANKQDRRRRVGGRAAVPRVWQSTRAKNPRQLARYLHACTCEIALSKVRKFHLMVINGGAVSFGYVTIQRGQTAHDAAPEEICPTLYA